MLTTALAARSLMGNRSISIMASRWANRVTTQEAAASASKGTFSRSNQPSRRAVAAGPAPAAPFAAGAKRPKASNPKATSSNGSVTSIGLAIRPRAYRAPPGSNEATTRAGRRRRRRPRGSARKTIRSARPCVRRPRPRIPPATDGRQRPPPPARLASSAPVMRRNSRKRRTAVAACNSTLLR